jgi:hypothetical protein
LSPSLRKHFVAAFAAEAWMAIETHHTYSRFPARRFSYTGDPLMAKTAAQLYCRYTFFYQLFSYAFGLSVVTDPYGC